MFRFKQFSIEDSGATMKVGTDAVLLGTLALSGNVAPALPRPRRILDIGTGCGILALMMAQRFADATVDAIDIDGQTTAVAAANFDRSPWGQRIKAANIDLRHFAERHIAEQQPPYDLIISNPPYFANSLKNSDPRRTMARHSDNSLDLPQMLRLAAAMLTADGILAIIIPAENAANAASSATQYGLQCVSSTGIANHIADAPKRSVLHFARSTNAPDGTRYATVALRNADNSYSDEYKTLMQPFLL